MGKRGTLIAGVALGLAVFATPASALTFNGGAITINDVSPATPYGTGTAAINVSGTVGTITDLNIGITGFNHTYTDDVAALLVAPNGVSLDFWDGIGTDTPTTPGTTASNVNLLFDDGAAALAPVNPAAGALASGSYKPTDQRGAAFPAPAPNNATVADAAPFGVASLASVFNGLSANGTWKLFVVDNFSPDSGSIASWRLEISGVTVPPAVTGKRAAALKKCKKKFKKTGNKKKYKKCKKRARRLPV